MKKSIIYIKQPLWARVLNVFKFRSTDISEIDLDPDTWHDNEGEFVWSYPEARIRISNTNSVCLVLKCPIGREVVIKSKYFGVKRALKKDKVYTFVIDTKNLEELSINTTPFTPSGDTRELGLCFYNITDRI